MLNIISGDAGTGKSQKLRELIKETVTGGGSALLIVPDQFSFEAEKLVYRTVKPPYKGSCRVTTFSKEAQRILKLHGEAKPYADDVAKRILIKLALENARDGGSLMFYKDQTRKKGFPRFALGMIADMRGAGISPAELRKTIEDRSDLSSALTKKLNDISVIYSEYDRLLAQNFSDRLDDVRRASELIYQTDEYTDCEVFIDEFDGFSGSQTVFTQRLIAKAAKVTAAFTCDWPECKEQRYDAVCRLIWELSRNSETKCERLTEQYRKPQGLRVIQARDKWQECEWICAEIRRLTDGGARFRDIAVVCPDIGTSRILDSTMTRYGIKGFVDIPEPLLSKWFVRFPIYTMRALSFETEDILRYVKSGFVREDDGSVINGLKWSSDAADKLEMLSRKYDLRRRDWLKPFPEKLDDRERLEALRKCVIEPLQKFAAETGLDSPDSTATGDLITKKLCDFMCSDMRVTGAVKSRCITGRDSKGRYVYDRRLLDELSEIWDDMITVFEAAYRALKGRAMTAAEYTDILSDAFAGTTISKPPQTLDAVTVGDPDRSRFTGVKYVFVCGFNRGVMPPPARVSEIFTPAENEKLSEIGIPVSANRAERCAKELYIVYRCVNMPSEQLYITYPLMNEAGTFLERSEALNDIDGFDPKNIEGADNFDAAFYCRTRAASERYLARIYGSPSHLAERKALMNSERSLVSDGFRRMVRSASGERIDRDRHRISAKSASKLLVPKSYSPSLLTTMNKCKFAYFCHTGLGLRDREDRSINAILTGNVIHFCLNELIGHYLGDPEGFKALGEKEIKDHVLTSLENYKKTFYYTDFGGEARFSYLLNRLGIYAVKSALKIQDELKYSGFYPEAVELPMNVTVGGIELTGQCDRIDSMTENNVKYIRIIDYKRSKRDFPLTDIYNGNNLQTLLYLYGMCDGQTAVKPASVMYVPVGQAAYAQLSSSADVQTGKDITKLYYKEHSPSGIIIADTPAKTDLNNVTAKFREQYATKQSKMEFFPLTEISADVYDRIHNYIVSYLRSMIDETAHGIAGACPKSGACKHCSFSLFCGRG